MWKWKEEEEALALGVGARARGVLPDLIGVAAGGAAWSYVLLYYACSAALQLLHLLVKMTKNNHSLKLQPKINLFRNYF